MALPASVAAMSGVGVLLCLIFTFRGKSFDESEMFYNYFMSDYLQVLGHAHYC